MYWTSPAQWKKIKSKTFKRDDFKCVTCGKSGRKAKLLIHHKDEFNPEYPCTGQYRKKNNSLNNLLTVCYGCHNKLHGIKGRELLPRRLRLIRSRIFKKYWDEYKGELDMKDLAEIFRVGLSQFFKIVSEK